MKDSPLAPEKWSEHPYLYNDSRRVPLQRPAMVLDLLDATKSATLEQATAIALSPQVWHAELWQERIRKAAPENAFGKMLTEWDRRSDADSRGALGFYLFKTALGADGRAMDPPDSLSDEAVREVTRRLEQASLEEVESTLRARALKAKLTPLVDVIVAVGTCLTLWFGTR